MNTVAQDLFTRALELPQSERDAFLAEACAGDAELRLEVQRLLVDAERAASFFSDTEGATLGAEEFKNTHSEKAGDIIGPYKLREQIGEGGFGSVWVADQEKPVRRRVALKLVKAGMDTKQVIARFEQERQALAMMDHPNISKVLDAGATERGRPYFVMELVRGVSITEYCDQNRLPTPQRLALFITICQAVQHAHQKGIIHRDIKPSNILVTLHDGVPVPKVIDFGIAKATEGRLTDATIYTQLQQFVGTPAYMSLEQAEMSGLDIDTRSDIYSLGVLLYELLTGKTPFDAKELMSRGVDAMRKTIREEEPARPSTRLASLAAEELTTTAKRRSSESAKLMHQLRGDLDWIVIKCLEKDRTRRYDTANGLAADLKRHLNNEPVVARPPSAAYKFQKLARRNKLAFAAVGAVTMALVLGIIASSWQAVRATRATHAALIAGEKAEAAQLEAQKNFDAARAAEKDARQQAATAQEISDRSSAAFMLSQGRLRDALTHARAALAHADTFENRLVATAIVDESRHPFILEARVTLAEPPRIAAALTQTRIVIASAASLHLIDLPDAKPAATIALPGTPMYLVPLGPDRFLVALPDRFLICTAMPLAITASIHLDDGPLDVAATPDGKTIALLFASRVEARDGHDPERILASAPTNLRAPRAGSANPFRVSISPSGHTVLALGSDPWGPSTILNVSAGTNRAITPLRVNCRLLDDTTLIGLSATSNEGWLEFSSIDFSAEQIVHTSYGLVRTTVTSGAGDLYIASVEAGKPASQPRLAFIADQAGVHLAQFPDYPAIASRRYDSLWPQEIGRVNRIGISPDAGKLFLATGNHALVFAARLSPPKIFHTTFWSVAVTPDACYTVTKNADESGDRREATTGADSANIVLMERRFDQNRPQAFALAWPSETPSEPWGLAITPDGRTAAVLCQESDNTTVSGSFYEKYLLIYALPPAPPTDSPVPIARKIHLRELSGTDGRRNGRPIFSPDGKTLLYYTSSGDCYAYAVETGARIWSAMNLGSIAISPLGDLLASGDYRTSARIGVRDVATGQVIYSTPGSYKVRKLALTYDRKLLAAVDEDTFLTIDLASGAESSRSSLLCPVTVSPDGTRMIAFLPEEPGLLTGSTVLADNHTDRIIEVLNASAHLLNFATFTPQGDRIVLGRNRFSVSMIAADPWERLAAALVVPGYPATPLPRNATAAKLATLYPPPAAPLPAAGAESAATRLILPAHDGAALTAHLGAEVEAEGTISSARWNISDSVMMIEFEGGNNRGLLATVFAGDRDAIDKAFPPGAAAFLSGKKVRIRGKLERYSGKSEDYMRRPQIILRSPDQLSLLADAPATVAAAELSAPADLRINATDHAQLAAHLDSAVTVLGTVRTASWTANESIFNMDFEDDDEHGLLVCIFPKNRAAFERSLGGDIGKALSGKTIEVKGELQSYGGRVEEWMNRPQIILNTPSQLRLLPANDNPGTP